MKVFDVFPLGYETDILLLRLQTLADVVDEFCIVEGDRTYAGQRRLPLWSKLSTYPEFARFADRVHHRLVKLPELEGAHDGPWLREHHLRGAMLPLVDEAGCRSSDTVIISDVDEIPHPDAVRWFARTAHGVARLPGYYHQLRLDLRAVGSLENSMEMHPVVRGHLWEFRQPLIGMRSLFRHAQTDRATLQDKVPSCPAGFYGWHLTCQGTPADIVSKLQAYSHTELAGTTVADIEWLIESRTALAHNVPLVRVPLGQMPLPVQWHPGRWKHLLTEWTS